MNHATKTPKLSLSTEERALLKHSKVRLSQIASMDTKELAEILSLSPDRAKALVASAHFQGIHGVGPSTAKNLVDLGYHSIDEMTEADGSQLYDKLERMYGCWLDPCVEDGMRWIANYARNRDSSKQWFDFTEERKRYREQHGYAADRPTRAWYER